MVGEGVPERVVGYAAGMHAAFADLQGRLRELWPAVTLRSIGSIERTIVVVHSFGLDVPAQLIPVFPAYEERFLVLVLSLLRAPASRVIYVTSQPIQPKPCSTTTSRSSPSSTTQEARARFVAVALVDGRNEPLSRKLLALTGGASPHPRPDRGSPSSRFCCRSA